MKLEPEYPAQCVSYGSPEWQALPIADRPSFYALAKGDLCEPSPYESDGGYEIGRDPRKVPRDVLAKYHEPMPVLRAIRAKCIDCSGGSESEARKCTVLQCPLWPFRMGTNPHRDTANLVAAAKRRAEVGSAPFSNRGSDGGSLVSGEDAL